MDFEYVALEWRTGYPKQDITFMDERQEMLGRGWTEHLRAGWPQERMPRRLAGGICIMRRGKGGDMQFEYVALTWQTHDRRADECFMADYHRLYDAGWEVSLDASFEPSRVGGACIMRRPKDEPRKWTKGQIEEIAKGAKDAVLNERVMRADLCGRLERRNAELQVAINEVVATSTTREWVGAKRLTLEAVKKCLWPLATKTTVAHGSNWTIREESNG